MTYDEKLIDALIAEAREDDARMPVAPWTIEHDRNDQPNIYARTEGDRDQWVAILPHQCLRSIEEEQNINASAICRTRGNLPRYADALESAKDEILRLRQLLAGHCPRCHEAVIDDVCACPEAQ